jgi:hypothetical protein
MKGLFMCTNFDWNVLFSSWFFSSFLDTIERQVGVLFCVLLQYKAHMETDPYQFSNETVKATLSTLYK